MGDAELDARAAEEYVASLPDVAQAWMREFTDYVATHYPSVPYVMFRGRPMFKFEGAYQKGYVMFTAAAKHLTAHAIDAIDVLPDQGRESFQPWRGIGQRMGR